MSSVGFGRALCVHKEQMSLTIGFWDGLLAKVQGGFFHVLQPVFSVIFAAQ
jgi:hypothetical protein